MFALGGHMQVRSDFLGAVRMWAILMLIVVGAAIVSHWLLG
jgi:hypothetical protein